MIGPDIAGLGDQNQHEGQRAHPCPEPGEGRTGEPVEPQKSQDEGQGVNGEQADTEPGGPGGEGKQVEVALMRVETGRMTGRMGRAGRAWGQAVARVAANGTPGRPPGCGIPGPSATGRTARRHAAARGTSFNLFNGNDMIRFAWGRGPAWGQQARQCARKANRGQRCFIEGSGTKPSITKRLVDVIQETRGDWGRS